MKAGDSENSFFYDVHVFCCINERADDHPRGSCAARGSIDLHKYMKARAKELNIKGIRVNKSGCLDRCELGPMMVIYPAAIWYHFDTREDIDDILERQIIGGQTVERLALKNDQELPEPLPELRVNLRIKKIKRLTATTKMFELVAADGEQLPPFSAGGHIDIFTGNGLRRSYSLTNDPAERQRYEIAVMREVDGRGGSAWMHDNLAIADIIEATAPNNNFPLNENATKHIMIAGGIGITPLLSMGRHLGHGDQPATLYYCTRGPEATAYAKEVKDVFGDQAHFHHDGGDPKRAIDLKAILATPEAGASIYVCGPAGLIDAAREAASHWPEKSLRFELFGPAEPDPAKDADNEPFDIILSRQKKTLRVPPAKSILHVIKEAGIEVESACQEGMCGSCRVRLLAGKADHRDNFLDDLEKQQNNAIMICSSRAQKGETLILDI